jgi:uncharacterized protein (TIGR00730 family)
MKVTVFGGAAPKPDQPDYQEAMRLGRLLAKAGHTVLTGGYMGTMEAVSRGAAEAGGHTIGVTCEEIERWRSSRANPWVHEEWKRTTLSERMTCLIENGNVLMALPGGAGTLAEISLAWNRLAVESLSARPLILIGDGWRLLFETFFQAQETYVRPADRSMLTFAGSVDDAVASLPK